MAANGRDDGAQWPSDLPTSEIAVNEVKLGERRGTKADRHVRSAKRGDALHARRDTAGLRVGEEMNERGEQDGRRHDFEDETNLAFRSVACVVIVRMMQGYRSACRGDEHYQNQQEYCGFSHDFE